MKQEFYSKNEFILCTNVTKHARNDVHKKPLKMVLLFSIHIKMNVFWRMVHFFKAKMSLFYAQKGQSKCDKIRLKWQVYLEKALKIVLLLSTRVKTNAFWRMAHFYTRMSLFYAQKWKSNCDIKHTKWQVCVALGTGNGSEALSTR